MLFRSDFLVRQEAARLAHLDERLQLLAALGDFFFRELGFVEAELAHQREFGLDETQLTEEEVAKRRQELKTLIKMGKTRGFLTHQEINDHLPEKLVNEEILEAIVSMLNDMGIAVYEQAPDAATLLIAGGSTTTATEEEAEEAAEAALSTVESAASAASSASSSVAVVAPPPAISSVAASGACS